MATAEKKKEDPAIPEKFTRFAEPPESALRAIKGGRLTGKTDINPQWRIECLTALFGMCGEGWWYEVVKEWTHECNQEVAVFVRIALSYRRIDGSVSAPIYATGGSMLVEDEKGGLYLDDDAWKMATTDALGVACKHLGIASNIYRGFHERTKTEQGENRSSGGRSKAPPCPKCGNTDATIVGKPEYGGGFVCYRAKGGCGHKWQAGQETKREGDPPAQPQHSERVVDILDAIAMSEELRHLEKIGAEIKALAPPLDATERQTLASAYSKRAKQLEEAIPF